MDRPEDILIQNSHPEIKKYILALECRLKNFDEFEKNFLDVQEELFEIKIQNHEYSDHIKMLKTEIEDKEKQLQEVIQELRLAEIISKMENNSSFQDNNLLEIPQAPVGVGAAFMDSSNNNANSILIKCFPKVLIGNKRSILLLGQRMKLEITEADIKNITIKESKFYKRQQNLPQPDNLILIVEFARQETKVDFLKHKETLKTYSSTQKVEITDYVSEDAYNLYQYAKILKEHGYNSVYWRNNCVYVKKTRSTNSEPILIKDKSEVDVLKALK